MIRIGCLCIVVAVTTHTSGSWIGIITLVTLVTGQTCMRSLNWIKTVVKGRRRPNSLRMTTGTVCRELLLYVIRTDCLIKLVGMTARTGVGRIIEISAGMALIAVVCNSCMCSKQRIIIIVYGKRSRTPACVGSMTGFTGSGQVQLCVIRVLALYVIVAVATVTSIGCIVIVSVMTSRTVSSDILVRASQYIEIVVYGKRSWLPAGGGMTRCAVG